MQLGFCCWCGTTGGQLLFQFGWGDVLILLVLTFVPHGALGSLGSAANFQGLLGWL